MTVVTSKLNTTVNAFGLIACFHSGNYAGGLGRHHVLCHGCTLLLQLHLLHFSHYSKYRQMCTTKAQTVKVKIISHLHEIIQSFSLFHWKWP